MSEHVYNVRRNRVEVGGYRVEISTDASGSCAFMGRVLEELAIRNAVAASLGTRTAVVRVVRLDELEASNSARYAVVFDLSRPYVVDWLQWVRSAAGSGSLEWLAEGYRVRYLRRRVRGYALTSQRAEIEVRVFKGERAPHIRYDASPSHRAGARCDKACPLCHALRWPLFVGPS